MVGILLRGLAGVQSDAECGVLPSESTITWARSGLRSNPHRVPIFQTREFGDRVECVILLLVGFSSSCEAGKLMTD